MADPDRSDTNDLLIALRHPLRRQILRAMAGDTRPLSPRELASSLAQPLSNVSYHVRVLADCSVLELVGTRQVRGSMQHFYRSLLEAEWALFALGIGVGAAANGNARGEEIG
ncbi:MAG TPA: helix-turn-helix domain-containing protein [Solirubrobacterales bacterium]|jgi:DNA-binding transcriptional ArsR family regulator|nr:helix-turn-helix domain-containing protein [Solirubrobacterales bacterium]